MKIFLFVLIMCLLSAVLIARDLSQLAKAEKERRRAAIAHSPTRLFTNQDLERYHRTQPAPRPSPNRVTARSSRSSSSDRDISAERRYWQKETERHRRDLARLDARIRRTKWRLAERKARRKPGERLRDDPAEKALEETLKAMEEEKRKLVEEFRERGRRQGALPGWLR